MGKERNDSKDGSQSFDEDLLEAKTNFFRSLCIQLEDVRELRRQYDKENEIEGHVPSYRKVPRQTERTEEEQRPVIERNAPALTKEQMHEMYNALQQRRDYTVEEMALIWDVSKPEVRRRCFWLKRHRFVRFHRVLDKYEVLSLETVGTFNVGDNWRNRLRDDRVT